MKGIGASSLSLSRGFDLQIITAPPDGQGLSDGINCFRYAISAPVKAEKKEI
jgi:hypothetical protein